MAQKQLTRRQLGEEARRAAFEGNWEEAVSLNLQIIDRFQKHFMGELELSPTQIRVGEILLRKVIPT